MGVFERLEMLELGLDPELEQFIYYVIYQKSNNSEQMNYQVLFDLFLGSPEAVKDKAKAPSAPEERKSNTKRPDELC